MADTVHHNGLITIALDAREVEVRISADGVVVMRVGVRDSLVQWVDEKPWRFKLILLFHTAVVGTILLIFGIRF